MTLSDLKPDVIQRFYDHKIKSGRSAHAVHQAHKVLSIALQHALKLGLIPRNPCQSASPPKPKVTEMAILDEDQIQHLLATAHSISDQYYPLYCLAIHTGMRQSELIGLQWNDLDWERKKLKVQRQVFRPKGGGFEFSNLKTRKAHRTIVLGDRMLEVLKTHKRNLVQLKANVEN